MCENLGDVRGGFVKKRRRDGLRVRLDDLGVERRGRERNQFGDVKDVMNLPGGGKFDPIRDFTYFFDDFEGAVSFVVKFSRG